MFSEYSLVYSKIYDLRKLLIVSCQLLGFIVNDMLFYSILCDVEFWMQNNILWIWMHSKFKGYYFMIYAYKFLEYIQFYLFDLENILKNLYEKSYSYEMLLRKPNLVSLLSIWKPITEWMPTYFWNSHFIKLENIYEKKNSHLNIIKTKIPQLVFYLYCSKWFGLTFNYLYTSI